MANGKTPGQKLVAAGCMAESHGALVGAVPGVDAILSTRELIQIGDLLGGPEPRTKNQEPKASAALNNVIPLTLGVIPQLPTPNSQLPTPDLAVPGDYADWRTAPIRRHAGGPSAYLKISDGCNLR